MKSRPPSMKTYHEAKKTYHEAKLSLGNARSLAPIIKGIRKFPNTAGMAAMRKKKIMMIPWALNILL